MAHANESGTVIFADDLISYRSSRGGQWSLSLAAVRLIGECTNESGPFLDDYFLCFATVDERWWEVAMYAEGMALLLRSLNDRLGSLQLTLNNSTSFASNILWPTAFSGQPMFTYTDTPAKTRIGRLLGSMRNQQVLSPAAIKAIRGGG